MSRILSEAHRENDKAVMSAYGFDAEMSETEIVAELFKLYEKLTKSVILCYNKIGGEKMSDFAYAYFNTELEKLDVPDLEGIFEKVQKLLAKKKTMTNEQGINKEEVERINAVYAKIPCEEQIETAHASMRSMWEAVKNDSW